MNMRIVLVVALLAACQKANWNPDPPWASVPITVRWDGIDPVFDGSLRGAIGAWNHAAGCDVLRQAAAPGYDPASGQNLDVLPWVSDADGAAVGGRYCR